MLAKMASAERQENKTRCTFIMTTKAILAAVVHLRLIFFFEMGIKFCRSIAIMLSSSCKFFMYFRLGLVQSICPHSKQVALSTWERKINTQHVKYLTVVLQWSSTEKKSKYLIIVFNKIQKKFHTFHPKIIYTI